MRTGSNLGICVFVLWFGCSHAWGDTYTVSPGDSIPAAIDAAIDYDEIVVGPGKYVETINFSGKAIVLRSSGGPDITMITTDAAGPGPVVVCTSGEDHETVLEGFTISGPDWISGPFWHRSDAGGMYNESSCPREKLHLWETKGHRILAYRGLEHGA